MWWLFKRRGLACGSSQVGNRDGGGFLRGVRLKHGLEVEDATLAWALIISGTKEWGNSALVGLAWLGRPSCVGRGKGERERASRPRREWRERAGLRLSRGEDKAERAKTRERERREKISIFFSFSNISKPFSNSF
jgi:hypothetical protein